MRRPCLALLLFAACADPHPAGDSEALRQAASGVVPVGNGIGSGLTSVHSRQVVKDGAGLRYLVVPNAAAAASPGFQVHVDPLGANSVHALSTPYRIEALDVVYDELRTLYIVLL